MAWEVVNPLDDLRDQLNEICPNRDKTSDGSIGDTSHAAGKSSHNPDKTGNPEYADGDAKDEVRARDFDKDLRSDITAEQVVQHLVTLCRSGVIWWLRYIIYNGHIWRANGDWLTEVYTGVNKHDHHFHVNSQFNQASDNLQTADYRLEDLVALSAAEKKWMEDMVRRLLDEFPRRDGLIKAPYIANGADGKPNTHWTLESFLVNGYNAATAGRDASKSADAKVTAIVGNLSSLGEAEQQRFAKVIQEFAEVPIEVMEAVTGGTDEQIAAALTTLLGDRKDAVVAILSH